MKNFLNQLILFCFFVVVFVGFLGAVKEIGMIFEEFIFGGEELSDISVNISLILCGFVVGHTFMRITKAFEKKENEIKALKGVNEFLKIQLDKIKK